jgi:hypothetical protein
MPSYFEYLLWQGASVHLETKVLCRMLNHSPVPSTIRRLASRQPPGIHIQFVLPADVLQASIRSSKLSSMTNSAACRPQKAIEVSEILCPCVHRMLAPPAAAIRQAMIDYLPGSPLQLLTVHGTHQDAHIVQTVFSLSTRTKFNMTTLVPDIEGPSTYPMDNMIR